MNGQSIHKKGRHAIERSSDVTVGATEANIGTRISPCRNPSSLIPSVSVVASWVVIDVKVLLISSTLYVMVDGSAVNVVRCQPKVIEVGYVG